MRTYWQRRFRLHKVGTIHLGVAMPAIISLIVITAYPLIASVRTTARPPSISSPVSEQVNTTLMRYTAVAQGQSAPVYKPRIRVWIQRDDIRPSIIHATPGKLLLNVENETSDDISLIVERVVPGQANKRAANLKTLHKAKRAQQELELGAGEYVFYEESRPNIIGKLIVEPNQ